MTTIERIRRVLPAFGVALVLAFASQGCSSQATFRFACEPGTEINGGLLLTIDVVVVDDAEERQIRQLGDDWFYSDLRRALGSRKDTVGVEAGCRETVVVPHIKGYERLAVIADYQYEGRGQGKSQMEFYGKDAWQGKTLRVRIFDRYLTITQDH